MRNTITALFWLHAERGIEYRARWAAHCVIARLTNRAPSKDAARQIARDCGLGAVPQTVIGSA